MTVLFLTQNPNRASTTVPTEGWFRVLRPRGLAPVVVTTSEGAFSSWARDQGIPTYVVPLPFPDRRRPLPFLQALQRVVRIARRHRVELLHGNEQDVYPITQYAARLLRLPKAVSVHFTMGRGFCEWAFSGRKQPDRMFFVSASSRDVCAPSLDGVVAADRRHVLRNGLDLDGFVPDARRREQARERFGLGGGMAIGVACALRPRKQLEHLFKAAATLPSAVHVVVAGAAVPGDEAYAGELLESGRRLLGERLHLLGHLDDLRDFYNGLDVFVNTSREEACSISVIESLACGCPVVGYASRSVDEQILPDGGEIVAQDDEAALAAALGRWTADRDRLGDCRHGARRQAMSLFDIRALSDQLWSHYGELIDRHDAAPGP
jgi:glycosyltransferase involved in cell wall biosynthesis